jgi:SRSO17 transposase
VLRLTRQTLPDQVWRVKAARVWLSAAAGWSAGTYWLMWASNDETGEEKFFLSNAAVDTPVEKVVRAAFQRAHVEHSFRVCKSELGFGHFEGRRYGALLRHLNLCLVALGFVAEHTERLRGEKPRANAGTGVPGVGGSDPELDGDPTRKQCGSRRVASHRVSPST